MKTPDHSEQCRCEERACLADVLCTLLCGQGKLCGEQLLACVQPPSAMLAACAPEKTYSTGAHCLNE